MSLTKYIKRATFINYLIKHKATGDLKTFAKKNNASPRNLSNILKEMKELGFPIKYCRSRNSYIYTEEGEMIKSLFFKYGESLSREELKHIGNLQDLCFSEKAIFVPCKND